MAKSSKTASKKGSGKRELIAPNDDKRYIKRDAKGRISESDDQGKSLKQDVKKSAKTKVCLGTAIKVISQRRQPQRRKLKSGNNNSSHSPSSFLQAPSNKIVV